MRPSVFLIFLVIFFYQCETKTRPVNESVDSQAKSDQSISLQTSEGLKNKETQKTFRLEKKEAEPQAMAAEKDVLKGYFAYAADAALFYPCGASERVSVIGEGDYLTMERTYTRFENLEFAEKVYVELVGTYKVGKGMEGRSEKQLVVQEFLGFERGKKCE